MIKLGKLVKEIMDAPPTDIVQHVSTNAFSSDFVNYIKTVENSIKKGYNKEHKMWYPYQDPAGWHIGYGHKIKNNSELEAFKKGASDSDIQRLLSDDLKIANKLVHDYIKRRYKVDVMLTPSQSEMLTDFSFNLGGLEKFPKFVDAILHNRMDIVKQEYVRNSGGKDLSGRNKAFYDRFLK